MIQNQILYWFSWFAFLLSGCVIIAGGLILLKTGQNRGVFITYAGFAGLALSGFLMTIAYGIPYSGG